MVQADPFAVIETQSPRLTPGAIAGTVREHYGLDARLEPLLGERDQNFRLQCDDGRRFVLKIANPAEDPQATEFQIEALLHLERYRASHENTVRVPEMLRTLDGSTSIVIESEGERHVARIVTYLEGVPLGAMPASPLLCRRLGESLAHLGRALRDFDHSGSGHALLWDLRHAPSLRKLLDHVADPALRANVAETLDEFEANALPRLADLRSQVIHGDLNPDNVLTDSGDRDRVAGVIDFGDMLKAPLVVDVAVGASYLRESDGHPLAKIVEFLAAYHSVTPLELPETDILFALIKARLAASIAIMAWRTALRGADDPYLSGASDAAVSAGRFLTLLLELPHGHARRTFRQVCASVDVACQRNRG